MQLTATKEVILSAGTYIIDGLVWCRSFGRLGAIGTPQILMLSGIGDRAELSAQKLATVVELPDVGKNMQDHPWVPLQWQVNSNDTLDTINRDPTLMNELLALYDSKKQGPVANNPGGNQIGWFRLPSNSSVLKQFGDPTAGPLSPHFELTFGVSSLLRIALVVVDAHTRECPDRTLSCRSRSPCPTQETS